VTRQKAHFLFFSDFYRKKTEASIHFTVLSGARKEAATPINLQSIHRSINPAQLAALTWLGKATPAVQLLL
jgi:hypothetical protein